MSRRITQGVVRPTPVTLQINDKVVEAYEGESVLTALMAAGVLVLSRDSFGRARTPFCNMGVCFDCLIDVQEPTGRSSRTRACLTQVRAGLRITVPE